MGQQTSRPTTAADDGAVGTVAWSNVTNILSSDDTRATAILLLGQQSHYLKGTGYQFAIPLDSSVDGIQADVEASGNLLSAVQDTAIRLLMAGTPAGDTKTLGSTWPTTDAIRSYGGPADAWNVGWTPQDCNDANFGVAITVSALLGVTAGVDDVPLTIFYTGSNRFVTSPDRVKVGDGMGCSNA